MNYNTPNESSLLDLIGALKGGMDPNTAYGVYQNVQQDQMNRVAQRQERLGGLAQLLSGTAMQGMPYSGAQALAEAQPGPAGPAVQQMLASLYPQGETSPPPTNANGAPLDLPNGSRPTQSGLTAPSPQTGMQYQVPTSGPTSTSPAFQPAAPSATEQIAMQQAATQQSQQQALQQFAVDASAKAAGGVDMQTFLVNAAQYYPDLFSTPDGIQQVQQIALTVFNAPGQQPTG